MSSYSFDKKIGPERLSDTEFDAMRSKGKKPLRRQFGRFRNIADERAAVRANLAAHGVLEADGSFKRW